MSVGQYWTINPSVVDSYFSVCHVSSSKPETDRATITRTDNIAISEYRTNGTGNDRTGTHLSHRRIITTMLAMGVSQSVQGVGVPPVGSASLISGSANCI